MKKAKFYATQIGADALFGAIPDEQMEGSRFLGEADFRKVRIVGDAEFQGTMFAGKVNFASADISGNAFFALDRNQELQVLSSRGKPVLVWHTFTARQSFKERNS